MKNKLLKETFISFIVKIILWSVIVPFVFFIVGEIISRSDFQWLYDISPERYYGAINFFNTISSGINLIIIFIIIWAIGAIILLYKLLKKLFEYIEALTDAANKLMDKNVEIITLPAELEDIQKKFNLLKRESEKNERIAKESEQRKNDLIVYLAHDLKTPLTSMIGYLSLLEEIDDMPEKQQRKYIKIALEKSYKLEDLINELFDITRYNSETILIDQDQINLTMMLEQIKEDFYPILKDNNKEIKLQINDSIILEGDSNRLARVFDNLIKNAINYSTDIPIYINVSKEADIARIIVKNKAQKIAKEKLHKLFDKFYRVDSSRTSKTGGSGLGLAIAKEIIELHNGSISAHYNEGYLEFLIELPIK